MTKEALNIANQCRATASHDLACNIAVDGGSGLLRELLIDAARVIEALAQDEQGSSQGSEQALDKLFEVENELGLHYDEKPIQDGNVCARCGGIVFDPVLVQPEQGPVAFISPGGHIHYDPYLDSVPLYTTPPKRPWGKPWVSLTDEEYDEIWRMDLNNKDIMDKTIAKLKEINT